MLTTLRTRLLASYAALLLITLILIGGTLLLFLRSRPLPTEDITSHLTATLLDVRLLERSLSVSWSLDNAVFEQRVMGVLIDEAATHDTRIMVVTEGGEVRFDSLHPLASGTVIEQFDRSPLIARPGLIPRQTLVQGHFYDQDGSEWLFVAQPILPRGQMQGAGVDSTNRPPSDLNNLNLMAAAPMPRPSLGEVIRVFGDTFLRPLLRAGVFGLLVALGLAALIARSVARPLQQMGHAARQIAGGDYSQRVPLNGPHEVKELAAAFNEMAVRVWDGQKAQRDFLANISHDLRTPLTSIQGFSQAIAEGVASDPAAARHAAQIIHDEAGRMHRMVESLLDMARIEAGRLDMLRRAVRISEVLAAVGESLSVKARDRCVEWQIVVPPDLPRIAGDGDRLAQVFTNLLDNAIRHTPPGGLVRLEAGAAPNGIVITVRDTGEGIPPADLPRIFERFYQVDKSRQRERRSGIGLGLAITRQIIEAHGGTIQVASTLGAGTVFTVWLPLPAPDMSTISARR